jgi:FMN-dependent NADH-azoreductase
MKLLHIDSSALGANSVSRTLTEAIVARFRAQVGGIEVIRRDLDQDPLPHLTAAVLSGEDAEAGERGARVLDEFLAADVVVIGVPMYNFSVPSTLKAWIDRIAVAGKTFRYGANGPEGLAGGKRVIMAIAQGGVHQLGGASDFQESYLRFLFGFLGIEDVEVVRAQGVNQSGDHRGKAIESALASLPDPDRLPRAA